MKRRRGGGTRTCEHVLASLTDYLEGALPPARHRAVMRHLNACPGCARRLDQLRATIAALGCLRAGTLTPAVLAALHAGFARERERNPARRRGARGRRP
ncbi:zf-HC2 domain-containing protein [Nonomuraea sp. NPDC049504]|uniref:anti-sigma factor family protein n=1 Tax=Nonomuraea sp. NPDC049504 TaxID=3154729 RepID=UPI00343AF5B8